MSAIDILPEVTRWRARAVRYFAGNFNGLAAVTPEFQLVDFVAAPDEPPNPFYCTVMRLPLSASERPMAVGVVSKTYRLVQHGRVADLCFSALARAGIDVAGLRCEVGLSELGEWMNFRVYLPDDFGFLPKDGHRLKLRLEAFNSVDGSSRLSVLLSWFRLVCSNGLTIKESVREVRDLHNSRLDLGRIEAAIVDGMFQARRDQRRIAAWQARVVSEDALKKWVDGTVSKQWGKKAACRVFHICHSGRDAKQTDPFEGGLASEKSVQLLAPVPGAATPARNLYDVSQALARVATRRNDAERRSEWQEEIGVLIGRFAA